MPFLDLEPYAIQTHVCNYNIKASHSHTGTFHSLPWTGTFKASFKPLRKNYEIQSEQPDEELKENDDIQELEKLPPSKKTASHLKRAAVKCREKLSILRDATYQCQDVQALEQIANILDEAGKHIKNHNVYRAWVSERKEK